MNPQDENVLSKVDWLEIAVLPSLSDMAPWLVHRIPSSGFMVLGCCSQMAEAFTSNLSSKSVLEAGIGPQPANKPFKIACCCAVRFAMDRAGMVGADSATHCCFPDITHMGCLPNMVLMGPSNEGMAFSQALINACGLCTSQFGVSLSENQQTVQTQLSCPRMDLSMQSSCIQTLQSLHKLSN